MTDPATILSQNGLQNAAIIVQAAQLEGIELARAAAMVQKESNGANIWGHDPVDTGGCYTKGGPVTVDNYHCYRNSPVAGWNGVGPCQLTYKGFIYECEALNPAEGAADPLTNCRIGFRTLKGLIDQYGDQGGARRYNGSGSAAEAYGQDFVNKLARWRSLLAAATNPTPAPSAPASGHASFKEGDVSADIWRVQLFMNRVFPAYSNIDAGPGPTSRCGPQTVAALTEFQRRVGIPTAPPFEVGPNTWDELIKNGFR